MQTQTAEYSLMIKRHTNELHELNTAHMAEKHDVLRKLFEAVHKQQSADLKAKLDWSAWWTLGRLIHTTHLQ
jgi:hypothetical protein